MRQATCSGNMQWQPGLRCHVQSKKTKGEDFYDCRVKLQWPPNSDNGVYFSYFGVFDGHGGTEAGAYCKAALLSHVLREFDKVAADKPISTRTGSLQQLWVQYLPTALVNAFEAANRHCLTALKTSGTTATVVIVTALQGSDNEGAVLLTTANVGDSHAFCDTGSAVIRLNEDHRVDNSKKEQERVKAEGGRVDYHSSDNNRGPLRIWPGIAHSLGASVALLDSLICCATHFLHNPPCRRPDDVSHAGRS
jgi:serine/threonine protein phosphatase PrpC